MRRVPADAWVAFILLALCGFLLSDLLTTEGTGAYVKTTTLPTALVIVLAILSVFLLVGSLMRVAEISSEPGSEGRTALLRVAAMIAWTAAFIAALPWLGYVVTTALFLIGANLLYGNRNPLSIVAIAVMVPAALYLFFERFMIVLLPSSRLFG